ncbi:MAG: endopeptidase La [Bryobacterales bacterium]|nr:endopeptidase La [Bryobacteraceae bacterium]MDW8131676.1 endopeptidase La [Bryobacterales bacterium]
MSEPQIENVEILPVLPLKNSVLFPHLLMPLSVGRPASLAAAEAALGTEEKEIVIVAQRDPNIEKPGQDDLYAVGTKAVIKRMSRPSESHMELIVLGVERMVLLKLEQTEPYLKGRLRPYPLPNERTTEVEALHRAVVDLATKALSLAQPQAPPELSQLLVSTEDPLRLVFLLASMLSLELSKEQALLEAQTCAEALRLMHSYLAHEVQVLELRSKIASQTQTELTKQQREYFLRQQLRAIQQELGEKDPQQAEIEMLRERLAKLDLPELVRKEAERELSRLEKLPPAAPDYQVIRTYLEFIVELPWRVSTEDQLDIARARQILDEDHYDLKDVKERILEHLGVLKLNPEAKAPILCFVGPPGVGKTSLGQSIARALGRKFERMSLGGLHDEAELRGHRRTYVGAMPGRIIQAIRRAGSNNPLLMLDEVDKLGRDFRGDPAAALLEILDPEQNREFRDNYLDLPFDLSRVFFITTANTLDTIPRPLLDRMEVLRLPGYSEEEKLVIAERYLIPRQLKQAGLTAQQCSFTREAVQQIISRYTREAGVRRLEQALGRVARKVALKFAEGDTTPVTIRPEELADYLGPAPFLPEELRKQLPPGVATGLAWTETGGEVLYVEATLLPGGRGLTITGHVGEVMQESAKAAQSYLWSHAEEFGIAADKFRKNGLHIHVPAGAIPKDGPSAGITMAVAMASLYSGVPARSDTAMTGEITLTGLVLPIGGVKEKVLAARRAGIKRVILPKANEKDLRELPDEVRSEIEFVFVERIEDVLAAAIPDLRLKPEPVKAG